MANDVSLPSTWELMKQGRFEAAYKNLNEHLVGNTNLDIHVLGNRALCLLNLNHPEDALLDFQRYNVIRPESEWGYIGAGISLWWLDRKLEAIEVWKNALYTKYTDAAGGVKIPAILYFGAIQVADNKLQKETIEIMKKRQKTKPASACPGPIASFLLKIITKEEFLDIASQNQKLKTRRVTQANFWVAVFYYSQNEMGKYFYYLEKAQNGHLLESEYYLAKYEFSKLNENNN